MDAAQTGHEYRNEKTREKKHVTPTIKEPLHKEKQKKIRIHIRKQKLI